MFFTKKPFDDQNAFEGLSSYLDQNGPILIEILRKMARNAQILFKNTETEELLKLHAFAIDRQEYNVVILGTVELINRNKGKQVFQRISSSEINADKPYGKLLTSLCPIFMLYALEGKKINYKDAS